MISFPAELVLQILSHVPIRTLNSLRLVCHQLKNIIQAQESSIYRNAAILHGYVPFDAHYDKIYPPRSLVGVDGWKSLCEYPFLVHVRDV